MKIKRITFALFLLLCAGCNQTSTDKAAPPSSLREISKTAAGRLIKGGGFSCEAEELPNEETAGLKMKSTKQALVDTSATGDDGSEITMLVVYTTKAKNQFPNTDSLLNSIRRAELMTNQVFANNGIDLRLHVVHTEEISAFQEVGMKNDLGAIISKSKSKGQIARDLRNQYFADVVCLIRSSGGGRATLLNPTTASYHAESAYMTIGSGCIDQSYFCFAHELGHLLGCNHNAEDTNLKGMYDYSYGWYFDLPNDKPDLGKIGTMMSYPGADNRLLYFSDPTLGYEGIAIGSDKANNAKTIRQTKKRVANYRVKPAQL